MDLLFSRYASPFILIDQLILAQSLSNYIDDLFGFITEEKQEKTNWEFFLHKIYNKSWKEFCDEISVENSVENNISITDTLIKSKEILNNFIPT